MPRVGTGADARFPALLLRSNPHRVGSAATPWQDILEPDLGYVLYHGDNKDALRRPETPEGNAALLEEFSRHLSNDPEVRAHATPLIIFRGIPYRGRQKGFLLFQGFGIIERVELITQFDEKRGYFPNYAFHCAVFSLAKEHEGFDWRWVKMRRDGSVPLAECNAAAPHAWRMWIRHGRKCLDEVRRRVARRFLVDARDQQPMRATEALERKTLDTICDFYRDRKHSFEALAAEVTGRILKESGGRYTPGWVTKRSGEGGVDFVGRLELGSGLSRVNLVVLGQAKCEGRDSPTNGRDIARTVARLRRGWIGAYVTTPYFSKPVQLEVQEDEYPLLLVHGLRLAKEVVELARENGQAVHDFLVSMDEKYESLIQNRRPEEVLLEVGGTVVRQEEVPDLAPNAGSPDYGPS